MMGCAWTKLEWAYGSRCTHSHISVNTCCRRTDVTCGIPSKQHNTGTCAYRASGFTVLQLSKPQKAGGRERWGGGGGVEVGVRKRRLQRALAVSMCDWIQSRRGGRRLEMRGCIHPSTGSPETRKHLKPLVRSWGGVGRKGVGWKEIKLEHCEPWSWRPRRESKSFSSHSAGALDLWGLRIVYFDTVKKTLGELLKHTKKSLEIKNLKISLGGIPRRLTLDSKQHYQDALNVHYRLFRPFLNEHGHYIYNGDHQ